MESEKGFNTKKRFLSNSNEGVFYIPEFQNLPPDGV